MLDQKYFRVWIFTRPNGLLPGRVCEWHMSFSWPGQQPHIWAKFIFPQCFRVPKPHLLLTKLKSEKTKVTVVNIWTTFLHEAGIQQMILGFPSLAIEQLLPDYPIYRSHKFTKDRVFICQDARFLSNVSLGWACLTFLCFLRFRHFLWEHSRSVSAPLPALSQFRSRPIELDLP